MKIIIWCSDYDHSRIISTEDRRPKLAEGRFVEMLDDFGRDESLGALEGFIMNIQGAVVQLDSQRLPARRV